MTTIIDKTKAPSARWTRVPPPATFKRAIDKERYWMEEFRRWNEGHAGLTGIHYFYLQMVKIKDFASNGLIFPYWRDGDELIFEAIDHARFNQKDILVGKRREIGLSTIGGGCLPLYFSLTKKGAVSLLTSVDKPRLETLLTEKLKIGYDGLDPYVKPKNKSRTKYEMYFANTERDEFGNEVETGSLARIVAKPTSDNPSSFEAYRALYGFIDEIGKLNNAPDAYSFMKPCFMSGFSRIGFMLLGGTAGRMNTTGGQYMQDLWFNAEALDIVTCFIPGWMSINEFSTNGHSDEKGATEWLEKKREQLETSGQIQQLNDFIQQYPLSVEEMFSIATESAFPPEITARLGQQMTTIKKEKPPIAIGTLAERNESIVFMPDKRNGKIHILEHPEDIQTENTYVAGIDPIPLAGNDKKGSNYSLVVHKRFINATKSSFLPVCIYSERDWNAETLAYNSINILRYYNAKALIETNTGGVIIDKFRTSGFMKFLALRPTSFDIKFVENRKRVGIHKSEAVANRQNQLILQYLTDHCENIWFPELIEDLLKYLNLNTDIADAFGMALLLDADWSHKEKKLNAKKVNVKIPTFANVNGVNKLVYKNLRK